MRCLRSGSKRTHMSWVPSVFALGWCIENPYKNGLWTRLLDVLRGATLRGLKSANWHHTSYCKQTSGKTPYRKNTTIVSSFHPARPLPSLCTRADPCARFREYGSHAVTLCRKAGSSASTGLTCYYKRSKVPSVIIEHFLDAFAETVFAAGAERLLLLDLFAGAESGRAGFDAYRRRVRAQDWARRGKQLGYVSVDYNKECDAMIEVDLADAPLDDVLYTAFQVLGWGDDAIPETGVFVWASPPCETYSCLNLGTNAARGGQTRLGVQKRYRPLVGAPGCAARRADALCARVVGWMIRAEQAVVAAVVRRRLEARAQRVRDDRRRCVAEMLEDALLGERSRWTPAMFALFRELEQATDVEDLEAAHLLVSIDD